MNQPLWKTREFLTVAIDLVVSAALYFGAKYLTPDAFEDVKWAIAALQPVAALFVLHYAVDRVETRVRSLLNK